MPRFSELQQVYIVGPNPIDRRRWGEPIVGDVMLRAAIRQAVNNLGGPVTTMAPPVQTKDGSVRIGSALVIRPGTRQAMTNLFAFGLPHGRIRKLYFCTHGDPEYVPLGPAYGLNLREIEALEHVVSAALASAAEVIFEGCDIAKGARGELFVAECGRLWLPKGGTVRAAANLTLDGYNPFRDVIAEVAPGGAVRLLNHSHLHPDRILRDATSFRDALVRTKSPAVRPWIQHHLERLFPLLVQPNPSYKILFKAYDHLQMALIHSRTSEDAEIRAVAAPMLPRYDCE